MKNLLYKIKMQYDKLRKQIYEYAYPRKIKMLAGVFKLIKLKKLYQHYELINIAVNEIKPEMVSKGCPHLYCVVQNTLDMYTRSSTPGVFQSSYPHGLCKTVLRVVGKLCIQDPSSVLVGVQPMSGPVGLVFSLSCREIQSPHSSISDPDEYSLPDSLKSAPKPKHISLEVVSNAVEAGTRKLQARFTLEAAQDLNWHGVDIEQEIVIVLAQEIANEFIEETYHDIESMSDVYKIPETTKLMDIPTHIKVVCNDIARCTRRGAGNVLIAPPAMITLFQSNPFGTFKAPTDDEKQQYGRFTRLSFAGTLIGGIKVFCDPHMLDNKMYVAYKGDGSETDAGMFKCPYHMVMTTGAVVDPITHQLVMPFKTRYGKFVVTPNGDRVTDGKQYYRVIDFNDVDLSLDKLNEEIAHYKTIKEEMAKIEETDKKSTDSSSEVTKD